MLEWVVVGIGAGAAAALLLASAREPAPDSERRRQKVWKRGTGINPLTGTILMVAITVVLAAVLYVMVTGLTGPR